MKVESAPGARRTLRRTLESWLEAARKTGFFILLVAGSGALGFAIAWPLWLFATSQREAFTIFTLCLIGGGCVALAARAIVRSRRKTRDSGRPRRAVPAVILAVLIAIVAIAGVYLLTVLVFRGFWILAIPTLIFWAGFLWLLGFARRSVASRAAKDAKDRPVPAENRSE